MEYVTLTRKDPEFKKFLWGTFSKKERALPLETFDAFSGRERVTFQILPVAEVERPSWWKVYLIAARPEMWLLTLGPALSVFLLLRHELIQSEVWSAGFALVSLFFLHNAACLANDVMDHLTGSDRANRRRGSQVIQKGWSSTVNMYRWAIVNFTLAVLIGIPALWTNPLPLLGVAIVGLICISVLLSARGARQGWSDLSVVILYGPLIVLGMNWVISHEVNFVMGLLGLCFGVLSMWVLQARQLENLFRSQRESHRTYVGYLDFELAKRSFIIEGLAAIGLTTVTGLTMQVHWISWATLPFAAMPIVWVLARVMRAASPLSSDFVQIGRFSLMAHGVMALWWWLALGFL
jgi:1,4-dihydroxy-2-naphthoate octaprenyltransferase